MFRKLMQLCVLTCVFTVIANAQQRGGTGGNPQPGNTPAPQPGNNRPTVIPQPTVPSPTTPQNMVIGGRIFADGVFDYPMVEVRLEYDGGQPISFAYTNSTGEFTFQSVGIQLDRNVYITIQMEGFKPHHERLDGIGPNGYGGLLTIFLERENKV